MRKDLVESKSIYKQYLSSKPEAIESYPFGDDCAVFKVRNKVFALFFLEFQGGDAMNLKCDPDQALALRDVFEGIIPGYHMNKRHWNTILLNGSVPDDEIERLIDHSYELVVNGLKKSEKQAMYSLYGENLRA